MSAIPSILNRDENWGRIVYDPESDEFEGHIFCESAETSISMPISVGCLVTGICDLKCAFCYGNDEALPKADIAAEEWKKIFQHMRSWGLMRVDLSGGEPTLRPDLPQIAQAAIDVGLNVVISTNGRRLSEKGPLAFPRVRWHVSLDSGFAEIHENSRLLRSLKSSEGGFEKTTKFIRKCLQENLIVRVMTCLGNHNVDGLFALGEHLALIGITEWNISRILRAGRAQATYTKHFSVDENYVLEQIHDLRKAFPFLRIRYSNRTDQDGYFLLVLPDGSLATQYTSGRDKVILGKALHLDLQMLQTHPSFDLAKHGRKWILANLDRHCVESLPIASSPA
jgi:MoaA/NifB/PqqE/SkfB family radical SAM enzyme